MTLRPNPLRILDRVGLPSLIAMFGLVILGCGDKSDKLYPVKGVVKVDGVPLNGGTIYLVPDAEKGNTSRRRSFGKIEAGGAYEIAEGGASSGWHTVVVLTNTPGSPVVPGPPVPQQFRHESTSTVKLEIVPSPPAGAYDIMLPKN